jgi:osmotically-inducible protein OsmY
MQSAGSFSKAAIASAPPTRQSDSVRFIFERVLRKEAIGLVVVNHEDFDDFGGLHRAFASSRLSTSDIEFPKSNSLLGRRTAKFTRQRMLPPAIGGAKRRIAPWRARGEQYLGENRAGTQMLRAAGSARASCNEFVRHGSCVMNWMHKSDIQLKQDVEQELAWDPKVNAARIGVTVNDRAVCLLGTVDTYAEKLAAEGAAKRVSGVRTIALDLKVKIIGDHKHSDAEIASAVERALEWDVFTPTTVTAEVHSGSVTLKGQATWNFERDAAERAVCHLKGVSHVSNSIVLAPQTSAAQVKEKIEAALLRQAETDAASIQVHTLASKVTLTGHATSWQAIEDAANAAWAAPGVTEVIDQVKLEMATGAP